MRIAIPDPRLPGGCGMAALKSDWEVRQDVVQALRSDVRIDATRISADVAAGVVTLRGTVNDESERAEAVRVARGVPGVVGVVDNLRIFQAVAHTDAEIADAIFADLAQHANVNPARVTVDVHGGTVHLRGFVRSLEQKQLAGEVAWWTAGVRDVVDELRVEPPGHTTSGA
jgi:osmotically-inducible protein OsmY